MPSAASSHLTRENPYVMNTIQVEVVSAEESIFSGEAEFVVLPGEVGELGVYPNHTPLITASRPVRCASGCQARTATN